MASPYPKKKKPAKKKKVNTGRYSQAELKKIKAARVKAVAAKKRGAGPQYSKAEMQKIKAARLKSVAAKKKAAAKKAPVKAVSKAKPDTGRYSKAEMDRIKAARLKYVGTPKYFMSDEYKKKVLAGRKKKPAGDEVSDFLKRRPLSKTTKTPPGTKKKAVVKKKSAVEKPVLTPKSLKKQVDKKAPDKVVSKSKPAKVAKKATVASKKKKKRSILGRLKMLRLKKMSKRGTPVTKPKGVSREELSPKGRIRKGAKKVLLTKGGAYASYEKGSKAAKSFQSAFKSGCAGGKKSFSWDGRSYSCKKK